ncbi:hypothetical protein [Duganella sp. Root1480D1]|uniref:hypothetical protein n=1 Tax=Duganella sp. Root1480D1 TaxID=1736471 RepID=UPI0026F460F4|nr:hypothetical protein [Duganella sp. Root1480D1]
MRSSLAACCSMRADGSWLPLAMACAASLMASSPAWASVSVRVHAVEAGLQGAAVGLGLYALAREADCEMVPKPACCRKLKDRWCTAAKAAAATITRQSW